MRALRPRLSLDFLKPSSSSTTVSGITTLLPSKVKSASGSWFTSLVSRMNVFKRAYIVSKALRESATGGGVLLGERDVEFDGVSDDDGAFFRLVGRLDNLAAGDFHRVNLGGVSLDRPVQGMFVNHIDTHGNTVRSVGIGDGPLRRGTVLGSHTDKDARVAAGLTLKRRLPFKKIREPVQHGIGAQDHG